jgi:pimeloyl-ACP methyl ester carboxylesterase
MKYDPTRRSLYFPETGQPLANLSADWERDWICAELSRRCYYRFDESKKPRFKEVLEAALAGAGFSPPRYFCDEKRDAQAFGTVAEGVAYLVFRGTQGGKIKDLLKDLKAPLVEWDGGERVHWGFRDAYQSLEKEIGKWLARASSRRLVVTGHSLGAAMATLMASRHRNAELVTFGSPRVGDDAFAARFEGRELRRYVDCDDAVTMVPPGFLGYVHAGDMAYIDRRGRLHAKPPDAGAVAEDRQLARRDYRRKHGWKFWRNVLTRRLADHTPINYVSAVLGRRDPDL